MEVKEEASRGSKGCGHWLHEGGIEESRQQAGGTANMTRADQIVERRLGIGMGEGSGRSKESK
jgi:hypothetical protein